MITGEVKNKVDKIWTDIWEGDHHPPHRHRTANLSDGAACGAYPG